MKYYSLNRNAPEVSFRQAIINGIAPDKGLYFPKEIPALPPSFFKEIEAMPAHEIAFQAIHPFVQDDLPKETVRQIIGKVLDFDFPLVAIEKNIATLELFHGPTMAFKDVGARFMANCLGHFFSRSDHEITVLVATSGDTGSAVANGFLGVKGVNVVILYPKGKVSDIQERQLTTLGQNITALKVEGTFDDCQAMVKRAFLDPDLLKNMQLTSANSINVARWLPQMFYFLIGYKQAKSFGKELVFSVPSGNFGNICAGLMAAKMGMPVRHFIAATNANDTVPHFMNTQQYTPKHSVATISNAMDVGDPSNFIRIRQLYNNDFNSLKQQLGSYSFSDDQTRKAMAEIHTTSGYVADPHGAVGYLGLKKYMTNHPEVYGIFLETAHPIKFIETVEAALKFSIPLPMQISELLKQPKMAHPINTYEELKELLINS